MIECPEDLAYIDEASIRRTQEAQPVELEAFILESALHRRSAGGIELLDIIGEFHDHPPKFSAEPNSAQSLILRRKIDYCQGSWRQRGAATTHDDDASVRRRSGVRPAAECWTRRPVSLRRRGIPRRRLPTSLARPGSRCSRSTRPGRARQSCCTRWSTWRSQATTRTS